MAAAGRRAWTLCSVPLYERCFSRSRSSVIIWLGQPVKAESHIEEVRPSPGLQEAAERWLFAFKGLEKEQHLGSSIVLYLLRGR